MATANEATDFGDEFIRPGEPGFTSFPKHLPEDTVSYAIYVLDPSIKSTSSLRSRLLEIQKSSTALTKSLLKDYIWQRESFNLSILPNSWTTSSAQDTNRGQGTSKNIADINSSDEILHLGGSTNFGDSIADEWIIVFLLRELSKTYEDTWIRVWDADGEFLLAEAASKLPKWLNPEIADYRVWINKGRLLIIPRRIISLQAASSSTSSSNTESSSQNVQLPRQLSLSNALDILSKYPTSSLIHDLSIEAEAFQRIQNYPADIKLSMHTSRILIPRNLAYILHRCPLHISPAIEAFYLRDPIALKPLVENANPEDLYFTPKDYVNVSIKFPRVGFAQLRGQEFPPPKTWSNFVSESADDYATRQKKDISMKLCCGFEMLLQDPKNKDERPVREIKMLLQDLENGDEQLPTDLEIQSWDKQDDSESWLDIDFSEFDKKLSGGKKDEGDDGMWGFKDKATEERTRMLMERLLSLMGEDEDDEGESSDDEMDYDDEDEDENYDINFDNENAFPPPFNDNQFRELKKKLGLPSEPDSDLGPSGRVVELDSDDNEEDAEDADPAAEEEKMQKVMADMEAELREAGFFDR